MTTRASRDLNTWKALGTRGRKKRQHSAKFGFGFGCTQAGADWKEKYNKGHTNGRNVCGVEIVLGKSDNQTCFAHTAVSDEQQFEKEIILFRHALKCFW